MIYIITVFVIGAVLASVMFAGIIGYGILSVKDGIQKDIDKQRLMQAKIAKEEENARLARIRADKVFRDLEVLETRQALIDEQVAEKSLKIEKLRKEMGLDVTEFTPNNP